MTGLPIRDKAYQFVFFDSARWDSFHHRAGDLIVCTSYKAGTTWTQMICALLVHQTPDLPRPLAELSPWLDLRVGALDEVLANYESQPWQRVVKTHTPLDALPYYPDAHYIYCGRDPRDVFMSLQNHLENANIPLIREKLAEQGIEAEPPPPLPEDINERFRLWLTTGTFPWEEDGLPYWSHFRHCQSFWDFRHLPNMHFLHYTDLKDDLEGQMRRLAAALGIKVPEEKWPELVQAAIFEDMKANADRRAPETDHGIWRSNAEFFHKGENEQWRGILSGESLALYEKITRERYPADLLAWLERGSLATAYPEGR